MVSLPIGNNAPYDLIADVNGVLFRIQVKTAWLDDKKAIKCAGSRLITTNTKTAIVRFYKKEDFDIAAVVYNEDIYFIPVDVFIEYKSCFHLIPLRKNSAKHDLSEYKNNWAIFGL